MASQEINSLSEEDSMEEPEGLNQVRTDFPDNVMQEIFLKMPIPKLPLAMVGCKNWHNIIVHKSFIKAQLKINQPLALIKGETHQILDPGYNLISTYDGVLVEQNRAFLTTFRIRNPTTSGYRLLPSLYFTMKFRGVYFSYNHVTSHGSLLRVCEQQVLSTQWKVNVVIHHITLETDRMWKLVANLGTNTEMPMVGDGIIFFVEPKEDPGKASVISVRMIDGSHKVFNIDLPKIFDEGKVVYFSWDGMLAAGIITGDSFHSVLLLQRGETELFIALGNRSRVGLGSRLRQDAGHGELSPEKRVGDKIWFRTTDRRICYSFGRGFLLKETETEINADEEVFSYTPTSKTTRTEP